MSDQKAARILTRAAPRRRRGVVLIEMAAVIMVMMVMTAGMIQFGRVFWHYNVVSKATRDAARYLSRVPAAELANAAKAAAARAFAKNMVVDAAAAAGVNLVSATAACLPVTACGATATGVTVTTRVDILDTQLYLFDIDSQGQAYDSIGVTPQTMMRYIGA